MKKLGVVFLSIAVVAFLVNLFTLDVQAIPAFARKYKTSCVTCHVAYPKLTPFGEAFRRNGFQFPESTDPEYIKEEPVSLGAEAYKEMFPESVWPGQIPGTAPLAVRFEGEYDIAPKADITNDLRVPRSMTVLTGGTLGENISFYSDIHLFDHGDVGFLNRAFLQFSNLLNDWIPLSALNVKVGQFTIAANPFAMHRDAFTLTPIGLNVYRPEMEDSLEAGHHGGAGSLELTQRGVEVDGVLKHHFGYALGVLNGNGIGAADHDTGKFDDNSMKDVYFRLAYKIGGMGLDGYTGEGEESFTEGSEYWIDNSIRIGVFGYLGDAASEMEPESEGEEHEHAPSILSLRIMDEGHDHEEGGGDMEMEEDQEHQQPQTQVARMVSGTKRIGFDLSLYYQSLNFFGAVLLAKDDIEGIDNDASSIIWFAESDYVFYPWLIGALRYDMVLFKSGEHDAETKDAKRLVPHLTILPRANMKFVLESPINLEDTDEVSILVGFDYAF
jgi:hypothetical protein